MSLDFVFSDAYLVLGARLIALLASISSSHEVYHESQHGNIEI